MAAENTNPILVHPPTIPDPSAESPTDTPTKTTTKPVVEEPEPMSEDPPAGSFGGSGGVRIDEEIEVGDKGGEERTMVEIEEDRGVEGESEVVVEAEELLAAKTKEPGAEAEEKPELVERGKSESEEEKSGDSKETKVLSEEQTEVVGCGDEKNVVEKPNLEEEVNQMIEREEKDIVVLDDGETVKGDKHEESPDQRTTRRKTRMARRIAEIMASGKDRKRGGESSEAEEEIEEEIPLIRRPRSTRVIVTEETPIPAAKEDDPAPVDEAKDAEEELVDEGKYKRERKRKGKLPERPIKKKVSQAARNVVIQEPIQVPYKQAKEKSDKEMEEEAENTVSEREEDPQPTHYRKIFVKVDKYLLKRMEKFKDPKLQEECKKRVTEGKKVKSGKKVHLPSLQDLAAENKFMAYIKGIGFEWLLELDMPDVPVTLAKEFFTSFKFKTTADLDEESISFRVYDREFKMSLAEWSSRLGLYSSDQDDSVEWRDRDIGFPRKHIDFEPQPIWRSLTHSRSGTYKATQSRSYHIADPVLRLAQVFLGYNLLGQANSSNTTTQAELYFMWCMRQKRKVHLGFWIAHACNTIATHPVRHLHICHLLGAFVKNNLITEFIQGTPTPDMCPLPTLFDVNFFIKTKVVKMRGGKPCFYEVGQADLPSGKDAEDDKASLDEDWKKKIELVIYNWAQASQAQKKILERQSEQMDRALDMMERMMSLVRETNDFQALMLDPVKYKEYTGRDHPDSLPKQPQVPPKTSEEQAENPIDDAPPESSRKKAKHTMKDDSKRSQRKQ